MGLYETVKNFIQKRKKVVHNRLPLNALTNPARRYPLSIKYKFRVNAKDMTTDQANIDSIVQNIIRKDYSKRAYAGKTDYDIEAYRSRIYRYESYRTQHLRLLPNKEDQLNVYVDNSLLGSLPQEHQYEASLFLETATYNAFAYVTGGPYKEFSTETNRLEEGSEPFDLTIYVQFS